MNLKLVAAVCGVLALALTGCPGGNGGNDGGTNPTDGGNVIGTGGCSGGCGPNLVCNEATHQCEPGCNPACAEGQLCVKGTDNTFLCQTPQTTCNGNICSGGESACIDGNCSCLTFAAGNRDTCAGQNKVCHGTWNPGTQSGGQCENANLYERCGGDCAHEICGACGMGQGCDPTLFGDIGMCMRGCSQTSPCGPDEFCASTNFCYPASVFGDQFQCQKTRPAADGGTELFRVSAPDTCLTVTSNGASTTETTPSGTCTWAFFKTDTADVPITYCRTAGQVPEFGACKAIPMAGSLTTSCGTGLECVANDTAGNGICLPICNAQTQINGASLEPSCNTGESCVNIYRRDDNTVVGACMLQCNVFSTKTNFGCEDYGTHKTSCVPTSANGVQLVSPTGNGICIAQRPNAKAEGETCEDTDPMKGATCQSGLVCAQLSGAAQPTCVKPCDIDCAPTDGGAAPARCAMEANATCGGGKSCKRVNGSSGATLGFCE